MRISDWSSDVCSSDLPQAPACPDCGGAWQRLGEDISEVLEYIPSSLRVVRHVRPRLSCRCCDRMAQAPAPSRPIARSFAGPGLLSHVMVSKYLDHQPLYRQCRIRSEEHTSELQSLMRISYAVFCLKKKNRNNEQP